MHRDGKARKTRRVKSPRKRDERAHRSATHQHGKGCCATDTVVQTSALSIVSRRVAWSGKARPLRAPCSVALSFRDSHGQATLDHATHRFMRARVLGPCRCSDSRVSCLRARKRRFLLDPTPLNSYSISARWQCSARVRNRACRGEVNGLAERSLVPRVTTCGKGDAGGSGAVLPIAGRTRPRKEVVCGLWYRWAAIGG